MSILKASESQQLDLNNKPFEKNDKPLPRFRELDTIHFHGSELFHHFILKCAVCYVLHRQGKRFQTEKPFSARKVARSYGEKQWYDGRNDYDVYDMDNDVPYEILLAQTDSQMPAQIKRKKEEYPPQTVFVIYAHQKPNIERIWREHLVPLWVFETNEYHAWLVHWEGNATFDSPFKVYNTVDDVLPELSWQYRRELQDIKNFGVDAKAILKARRERCTAYQKSGMTKDSIDTMNEDVIGVRSKEAIERRIRKLKEFGLLPNLQSDRC